MTVFYRLFKLFIFVILTPLFVMGVFLFYYQNYNKTEILNNYLGIAQLSAKFVQQNIESTSLRLSFAEEISDNLKAGKRAKAQAQLEEVIKINPDFVFLSVLDKKGREIIRSGTAEMDKLIAHIDLSSDDSIKGLSTSSMAITGFDDRLSFPFVEIVYPLQEGHYLFAVVSLFNIWDKISSQTIGITGGIFFVSSKGYFISLGQKPFPPISPMTMSEILSSDKRTFKEIPTDNGVFVGALTPSIVPDTYIGVFQFRKEAFYTISLISWLIAFFVLATTTLSYFAALSFSEEVSAPMEDLTAAAEQIANNNFDITVPSQNAWGEFEILVAAFNAMTKKLGLYKAVQLDKLLDEKRKTDMLAGLMKDGVVMASLNGEPLFVNQTAKKILNSDALCTRVACTMLGNKQKPEIASLFKLPSGTVFSYEYDHKTFYFEMVSETFNADKEDGVVLIIFRDITTEHEVNEMKNDIFNSVAHDLRAPILGLQAYLMILREGSLSQQEQQRALTAMENSSKTLTVLVENILDVSKLERGLVALNQNTFDLRESVTGAVDSLAPLAEVKSIKLLNNIPNGITITADQRLIERVLINLISNAIKFTEKGSVSVEYKDEGLMHGISVVDTGIGIAEDQLSKIFEKYHQVDKNAKGYGLGLTIVKQIIVAHKGEIFAYSKGAGSGCAITFRLPKD